MSGDGRLGSECSAEWVEALPFDERLRIALVWAKYREQVADPISTAEEGTLFHLKWAVAELHRRTGVTA